LAVSSSYVPKGFFGRRFVESHFACVGPAVLNRGNCREKSRKPRKHHLFCVAAFLVDFLDEHKEK
jgi:hypothetical protein